jgi:hypothetical protein
MSVLGFQDIGVQTIHTNFICIVSRFIMHIDRFIAVRLMEFNLPTLAIHMSMWLGDVCGMIYFSWYAWSIIHK